MQKMEILHVKTKAQISCAEISRVVAHMSSGARKPFFSGFLTKSDINQPV